MSTSSSPFTSPSSSSSPFARRGLPPVGLALPFPGESGLVGLFERRFGLEPALPLWIWRCSVQSALWTPSRARARRGGDLCHGRGGEDRREGELTRRMKASSKTKTFFFWTVCFVCGDKELVGEQGLLSYPKGEGVLISAICRLASN
jgi:hypothetical protein